MATFTVQGPFVVPTTKMKVGRSITKLDIERFWDDNSSTADQRGCYIFAFRAAKGSKPIYIGKATKTFRQEAFSDHKLKKYSLALANQAKGTPIMFFVSLKKVQGPVNKTAIDEVETYLIQAGLVANRSLLNDRKTAVEAWSIAGVVRAKGKASASATSLKKLLNLGR